jgi:O-antigen/teichoic acid export membrane protein
MPENYLKKLVKQTSMYFSSGVIITIAGFITFPIWTRVFTEAEYGQMSLATATLGIVIVFSKFGIQRAVLRFYSEFKENKRNLDITYYYTTSFLSVCIISLTIALVFLLVVEFYPDAQLDAQYIKILHVLPLLIFFDALNSIFFMFLRAEQNVKFYSMLGIINKYLIVLVSLLFVLVFKLGILGIFIGIASIDGLTSLFLLIKFLVQGKIKPKNFSFSLFKELVSYGVPLIGFELSALLLTSGDRFVIQHFLGSAAVGIYSASYSLTKYFVEFFSSAFRLAVMPIFMSIWEKKGREETQDFLSSVLKIYLMIGIPIIFAISFLGRDIIILFASKKFEEGCVIIPFIIIGYVIYSANFIYGAGLYLSKKTTTLLIINLISASINIILNLLLIPIWGLYGAAITTLFAFIIEVILLLSISSRTVSVKLHIHNFIKYIVISIVMVFVMLSIHNLGSAQLFVQTAIGFLTYGSAILLLETQVRIKARILIYKIFAR